MYNVIQYKHNFSKTSGISWQYCGDEPAINVADGNTVIFIADKSTTDSFKNKEKIPG